jgi:hypothetical protein
MACMYWILMAGFLEFSRPFWPVPGKRDNPARGASEKKVWFAVTGATTMPRCPGRERAPDSMFMPAAISISSTGR